MRIHLIAVTLAAAAAASPGAARANRTMVTPFVDPDAIATPCLALARVPDTSRLYDMRYDAAISAANCTVIARTANLELVPDEASVRALDDATAPSLAILDRVIGAGDPEHALIALYAKVDILQGNADRLRASMPKLSPQMRAPEIVMRDRLLPELDRLTLSWRQQARDARRELAMITRRHPELLRDDAVVAYMVAHSNLVETAGLAER
jgi:hypothetical protein